MTALPVPSEAVAPVGSSILRAEHITKRFGGLLAVDDVSFDIPERSIVSLIGPNGAGKTTFFNMLTGLYRPTEGQILFAGRNITRARPDIITARGVARTFQNIRLFGAMTAIENVMIGHHARMRAGVFGAVLRPPWVRREERDTRERARDLLKYVSNLIASRTSCPGLGRNEIDFIHVDFAPGRRVMAWKRGKDADPVVVVANFSDFESGADPEYRVTGWPTVSGRQWYEVTQGRNVPAVWVGREPVFRWEAKVYALRP